MLGEKIAKLRKQRKLSQYDLAERLNFSRGKLANYEQGTRQPDYETLEKIADFFEVTTDYLLGRTDNPDGTSINKQRDKTEENEFDPLAIIKEYLERKGGADQFGFFNIDEWKDLTPEQVEDVLEDIDYMFRKAKKRNEEKK